MTCIEGRFACSSWMPCRLSLSHSWFCLPPGLILFLCPFLSLVLLCPGHHAAPVAVEAAGAVALTLAVTCATVTVTSMTVVLPCWTYSVPLPAFCRPPDLSSVLSIYPRLIVGLAFDFVSPFLPFLSPPLSPNLYLYPPSLPLSSPVQRSVSKSLTSFVISRNLRSSAWSASLDTLQQSSALVVGSRCARRNCTLEDFNFSLRLSSQPPSLLRLFSSD